jgi:hypothetical protein
MVRGLLQEFGDYLTCDDADLVLWNMTEAKTLSFGT